jgi:hypothetical protein
VWQLAASTIWQREALALIDTLKETMGNDVHLTASSVADVVWQQRSRNGEGEASLGSALNRQAQKEADWHAQLAQEKLQREHAAQDALRRPADVAVQNIQQQGLIESATFAEMFSWDRGLKSGAIPPPNTTRLLVNYTFTFQTTGGVTRAHDGYVVMDNINGEWVVEAMNIDGLEDRPYR